MLRHLFRCFRETVFVLRSFLGKLPEIGINRCELVGVAVPVREAASLGSFRPEISLLTIPTHANSPASRVIFDGHFMVLL